MLHCCSKQIEIRSTSTQAELISKQRKILTVIRQANMGHFKQKKPFKIQVLSSSTFSFMILMISLGFADTPKNFIIFFGRSPLRLMDILFVRDQDGNRFGERIPLFWFKWFSPINMMMMYLWWFWDTLMINIIINIIISGYFRQFIYLQVS